MQTFDWTDAPSTECQSLLFVHVSSICRRTLYPLQFVCVQYVEMQYAEPSYVCIHALVCLRFICILCNVYTCDWCAFCKQ